MDTVCTSLLIRILALQIACLVSRCYVLEREVGGQYSVSATKRHTPPVLHRKQTFSPKDIDMSSRGFGRGGGRSPGGRSPGGRGRGGFGGRGGDGGGRFGRDEGPPAEIVGA